MTPTSDAPTTARCLHVGSYLVHERRALGPRVSSNRDELIYVCGRCGMFTITGGNDAGRFRVEFKLTTQEQLAAAALPVWCEQGRAPGRELAIGQPVDEALLAELRALRTIADVAADTVTTIDEYPQATTTEAFRDACWRLMRTLQRHGYDTRPWRDLNWRGSLLAALERAGLGVGADGEIHVRLPTDKPWQPAAGPRILPQREESEP